MLEVCSANESGGGGSVIKRAFFCETGGKKESRARFLDIVSTRRARHSQVLLPLKLKTLPSIRGEAGVMLTSYDALQKRASNITS